MLELTAGFAFDSLRILMTYHYGVNHTNKTPNFLVYPDIVLFHPLNFVANGARLFYKAIGFFSSATPAASNSAVTQTPAVSDMRPHQQ